MAEAVGETNAYFHLLLDYWGDIEKLDHKKTSH